MGSIINGKPMYARHLNMRKLRESARAAVSVRNDVKCLTYRLTDMCDEGILHCSAMDVVDYVAKNKDRLGYNAWDIPEGSVEAFREAVLLGKYDDHVKAYWEKYDYDMAHPVPMSDPDYWRSFTGGYVAEGHVPLSFRRDNDQ